MQIELLLRTLSANNHIHKAPTPHINHTQPHTNSPRPDVPIAGGWPRGANKRRLSAFSPRISSIFKERNKEISPRSRRGRSKTRKLILKILSESGPKCNLLLGFWANRSS